MDHPDAVRKSGNKGKEAADALKISENSLPVLHIFS